MQNTVLHRQRHMQDCSTGVLKNEQKPMYHHAKATRSTAEKKRAAVMQHGCTSTSTILSRAHSSASLIKSMAHHYLPMKSTDESDVHPQTWLQAIEEPELE